MLKSDDRNCKQMKMVNDISDNDVLCGRGRALENHPGNKAFRKRIHKFVGKYAQATRQEKGSMLVFLSRQMKDDDVHFYKRSDDGSWRELSESETKQKIGHALRDARERSKSKVATKQIQGISDQSIHGMLNQIQTSRLQLMLGPKSNTSSISSLERLSATNVAQGIDRVNDNTSHNQLDLRPVEQRLRNSMRSDFLQSCTGDGCDMQTTNDVLAYERNATKNNRAGFISFLRQPDGFAGSSREQFLEHTETADAEDNEHGSHTIQSEDNYINYIVEEVYKDFQNDSDDTNEGVSEENLS